MISLGLGLNPSDASQLANWDLQKLAMLLVSILRCECQFCCESLCVVDGKNEIHSVASSVLLNLTNTKYCQFLFHQFFVVVVVDDVDTKPMILYTQMHKELYHYTEKL